MEAGECIPQAAKWFPNTSRILAELPVEARSSGVVSFSWIHPDTHVIPHCGYTNGRLRVHMGLKIPTGVSLRVKDQHLTWREGKCIVFDDSFEHEVWHAGKGPRVILLLDILHPQLAEEDKIYLKTKKTTIEAHLKAFMSDNHLKAITREAGKNQVQFIPDDYLQKVILRKMDQSGIHSASLDDGLLRLQQED